MRISTDPADPGYTPHAHMCDVWLAGSKRNNIITADDSKRYAITFRRDECGAPVLDKAGAQVTERFFGDVRIDAPSWLRAAQEEPAAEDSLAAAIYGMATTP